MLVPSGTVCLAKIAFPRKLLSLIQIVESLSGCEATFLGIPLESSLVQNIQNHVSMSAQLLPAACQHKEVFEVGDLIPLARHSVTIGKVNLVKVLGAEFSPKGRRRDWKLFPAHQNAGNFCDPLLWAHGGEHLSSLLWRPSLPWDTLRDVFDGGHPERPHLYVKVQPSEIDHRSETTVWLFYQKQIWVESSALVSDRLYGSLHKQRVHYLLDESPFSPLSVCNWGCLGNDTGGRAHNSSLCPRTASWTKESRMFVSHHWTFSSSRPRKSWAPQERAPTSVSSATTLISSGAAGASTAPLTKGLIGRPCILALRRCVPEHRGTTPVTPWRSSVRPQTCS